MESLVSTDWLAAELGASDLRVVDATYFLAADQRNPAAEFEAAHIPGAVFMDLGEIVDPTSSLPMMLPSPEKFASRMQSLGLGDGSRIVVYDNSPYKSAARAWWMLAQVFGAHGVAILDGGFAKWQAEGRPVESGKPHYPPPAFHRLEKCESCTRQGTDARQSGQRGGTSGRCPRCGALYRRRP